MDSSILSTILLVLLLIIKVALLAVFIRLRRELQQQVLRIKESIDLLKIDLEIKANNEKKKGVQVTDVYIKDKKGVKDFSISRDETNTVTCYDEVGGRRYENEACEDSGVDSTNEFSNKISDHTSVASEFQALNEHKLHECVPTIQSSTHIIGDGLVYKREDRQFSKYSKGIAKEKRYSSNYDRNLPSTDEYLRALRVDKGHFNEAKWNLPGSYIVQKIENGCLEKKKNRFSMTELGILKRWNKGFELFLLKEDTVFREYDFGGFNTRAIRLHHGCAVQRLAENKVVCGSSSELKTADPKLVTTERGLDDEKRTLILDFIFNDTNSDNDNTDNKYKTCDKIFVFVNYVRISNLRGADKYLYIKQRRILGNKQSDVNMMTDGRKSARLCIPVHDKNSLLGIQYGDCNKTLLSEFDRCCELAGSSREKDIILQNTNTEEQYNSLDSGYSSLCSEDSFSSLNSDVGEGENLDDGRNRNAFCQGDTTVNNHDWPEKQSLTLGRNINHITIEMDQSVADGLVIQIFDMKMGNHEILAVQIGTNNLMLIPETREITFTSFEMGLKHKPITYNLIHSEVPIVSGFIFLELVPSDKLVTRLQSVYDNRRFKYPWEYMDVKTPSTHPVKPWSCVQSPYIQRFVKLACPVLERADFTDVRHTDFRPDRAYSSALTCDFNSHELIFEPYHFLVREKESLEKPSRRNSIFLHAYHADELTGRITEETYKREIDQCMIKDKFIPKEESRGLNHLEINTSPMTSNFSNETTTMSTNQYFGFIERECMLSKTNYTQICKTNHWIRKIELHSPSEFNQRSITHNDSSKLGEEKPKDHALLAPDHFFCKELSNHNKLYSLNVVNGHGKTLLNQLLSNLGSSDLCIRFQTKTCERETHKPRESNENETNEFTLCSGLTVTGAPTSQTQVYIAVLPQNQKCNDSIEKITNDLVSFDTNTTISIHSLKNDGINANNCNIVSQAACDKDVLIAENMGLIAENIGENGKNDLENCNDRDYQKSDNFVDSGFFDCDFCNTSVNDSELKAEPRETSLDNHPCIQCSPNSEGPFKRIGSGLIVAEGSVENSYLNNKRNCSPEKRVLDVTDDSEYPDMSSRYLEKMAEKNNSLFLETDKPRPKDRLMNKAYRTRNLKRIYPIKTLKKRLEIKLKEKYLTCARKRVRFKHRQNLTDTFFNCLKHKMISQTTSVTGYFNQPMTKWTDLAEWKNNKTFKDRKTEIKENGNGEEEDFTKQGSMSEDGGYLADIIVTNDKNAMMKGTQHSQNYQKGSMCLKALNHCLNKEHLRDTHAERFEGHRNERDDQRMPLQTQFDEKKYVKKGMRKGIEIGEEINHKGTNYSSPGNFPTKLAIQKVLCANLASTKTEDHVDIFQFLQITDSQFVRKGIICKTGQISETLDKLSRFKREVREYFFHILSPFEIYPDAYIETEKDIELRIRRYPITEQSF